MKENELLFVSNLFPFKGLSQESISKIFSEVKYSIVSFSKGEIIYSPEKFEQNIGFVIEGECEVRRMRADSDPVFLNTLSRYASFGILSFLSEEAEYPTQIRALRSASVLFISGEDMISIIKKHSTVAVNVISFLASRVAFMNKKMATFSERSTAGRLASYLFSKFQSAGAEFSVSRTRICSEIDVGRASLYRDLQALEEEGVLKTEGKKIIIICPEGLERKIK